VPAGTGGVGPEHAPRRPTPRSGCGFEADAIALVLERAAGTLADTLGGDDRIVGAGMDDAALRAGSPLHTMARSGFGTGDSRPGRDHTASRQSGCCWALMLLMFAAGTAGLAWMLALGAIMAVEKNAPGAGASRRRWARSSSRPAPSWCTGSTDTRVPPPGAWAIYGALTTTMRSVTANTAQAAAPVGPWSWDRVGP
jgi:Predicted metal-binding integral membrane protein (DUF2182)